MDRDQTSVFRLLQPELMNVGELKQLLSSRCVPSECLCGKTKEMLIDLYRRVVQPFPQRKIYKNRKGEETSSKRVPVLPPETTTVGRSYEIGFNGNEKKRTISSSSDCTTNERLKPPPEKIESNKKIKLSKSDSDLDHIVINNKRRSTELAEDSNGRPKSDNLISEKLENNQIKSNHVTVVQQPKKVTLKRKPIDIQTKDNLSNAETENDSKKQKTKITWP